MKISSVEANNYRREFVVRTRRGTFSLPYAALAIKPTPEDPLVRVFVDGELARECFTYELKSGELESVHMDSVLHYNRDPKYMGDLLLFKLTCKAQDQMKVSGLSTREVARRLRTSPSQLYRLLDQTNDRKSLRQVLALLNVLGCEVDFTIKDRASA